MFPALCTYEIGLSDFHKLTYTVLKIYYANQKLKFVKCRSFKNFTSNEFRRDM